MNKNKTKLGTLGRWSWFVFLLLTVFGYLVSGLSNRDVPARRANAAAANDPESGDADPISKSVAKVNQAWRDHIKAKGLAHADQADWMTICRRQSLALVGSQLSLEEIRELEKRPESERVDRHLNQLLGDPRFHDYWAERWARFLVGTDSGQFVVFRRRRFTSWLSTAFKEDWRYDRLVKRLVAAEGLWTDKPEVNFLTATFDSNDNAADPMRLAARTARCFLGLRIDCLQCHNDFLGNVNLGDINNLREGQQTDFHQLAAFYTSAKTNGFRGVTSGEVDYKYKYLDDDEETDVAADVPYQSELLGTEADPRKRLANWITHPENRQAARAAVSHIWALMYGRPVGEAVDNLPLDEEMHPAMEVMTDDFIANKFNIRRLIRVIANSSMFRTASRADFEIRPEHETAGAVFPLVRLRPEQVAGSIVQASRVKSVDLDSSFIVQLQRFGGIQDFVSRYGDMGEDEFSSENVTITQRLVMLNGKMLDEAIGYNWILNAAAHIHMYTENDARAIETVYLCTLNRRPTQKEQTLFQTRLSQGNRKKAIEDLYWILLNSTEFAWGH